jgi:hypothetical protein
MNNKSKGGRGHTAPYMTTHLRVPTAIKEQLQLVVDNYKELVLSGEVDVDPDQKIDLWETKISNKDEAVEIARGILKGKKSAKESMTKLLTALYGEKIDL